MGYANRKLALPYIPRVIYIIAHGQRFSSSKHNVLIILNLDTRIDLEDHPNSAAEAHQLLEEIRKKELRVVEDTFERRQNRTQSFHEYIQRQLDHPAQILPELIQNADDVDSCTTVEIELTDDTLRIRNDGRPMKTEEVDTLCAAGESTKRDPEYIGHFGLGFKSVFSISDNPRVRTGYFHFEFNVEQLTVPKILDCSAPINGTEIILPLKDELSSKKHEELQDRLDETHRLLTYLRNISQIEVTQTEQTTVYLRESESDSPEQIIYRDGEIFERRLVFETDHTPTGDAFEQLAEVRQIDDREKIRDSPISVTISFEVDEQKCPTSVAKDCYLFNFLPTDERSGFPFDVHADFLLESSRKALAWRDGAYNEWLLQRVGDTFREVVEYYRELDTECVGHLRLLPSEKHGLDHTTVAKDAVLESVHEERSIPGEGGSYHRPEEIVVPTGHVENVFTKTDVQHLLGRAIEYPAKWINTSLLSSIIKQGIIKEISVEYLLKQSKDSAREDFSEASTAHLLVLAAALWDYWDNEYANIGTYSDKKADRNEFKRIVKKTPLIPLEDERRVAISTVDEKPLLPSKQGRGEYDIFRGEFHLVLLDAASIPEEYPTEASEIIEQARRFYSDVLGIETIKSELVLKEIIAEAFNNVESTDNRTLDRYLEYIFSNKNRWSTAKKHVDLHFRIEGDEDDTYRNPKKTDIFLPDIYLVNQTAGEASGYSLENVLDTLDATFISEEYVSLTGEAQPKRWKEFLTTFDVLDCLQVNELPARERTYYTQREELVTALFDSPKSKTKKEWSVPDSIKKRGSKDQWFRRNRRYCLSDYVPDKWFQDVLKLFEENTGDYDRASAFDRMLREHWQYYQEKLHRPLYYVIKRRAYRVRSDRTDRYSTFGERLRSTSWCLTKSNTLARPRALLVENPSTANQSPQMYIAHEDSPYIESLGVKTQLGVDVTLEQLSNASDVWEKTDPPTIRQELTSRFDTLQQKLLDDDSTVKEKIRTELSDARFIYIEDADPPFRSINDVVWGGYDLGSYIVSIESSYEKYELLFNALDVKNTLEVTDYLDYLGDTAWEDEDQRDVVWRRAIRKLVAETSEISSLQELGLQVQEKLNEPSLLSLSNKVVSLDQLEYYCHDDTIRTHLRSELADRVVKPYDGRDYTNETIGEVWDLLGLTNLSSDATLSLIDHNATESDETPVDQIEDFTQLFTVAYSFCLSNGREDAADMLRRIFTDYQVTVHKTVECQYRFSNEDPITDAFEIRFYLDHETEQIRRTEDTSSFQEFTQRLPNELPLPATEREELESILSGALGKRDRYLNSFLDTFEIERHSIEATVQPTDSTSGEPAESSSSTTDEENIASIENPIADVYSADEDNDDTADGVSVHTSADDVSKITVTDSQDESPEKDKSVPPNTTPSPASTSLQETSQRDTGTDSKNESADSTEGQQSKESSESSDEDELPKTVRRRRTSTTQAVRDSGFTEKVRDAYNRTCAVCGNRRETKDGQPEIQAHHIRPVSNDGPDSVKNGIALCGLHHWAFEKGWIAVSDDYEIFVRDWETVPGYEEFREYHGKLLHLPDDPQHYPSQQYLRYHQKLHDFEI